MPCDWESRCHRFQIFGVIVTFVPQRGIGGQPVWMIVMLAPLIFVIFFRWWMTTKWRSFYSGKNKNIVFNSDIGFFMNFKIASVFHSFISLVQIWSKIFWNNLDSLWNIKYFFIYKIYKNIFQSWFCYFWNNFKQTLDPIWSNFLVWVSSNSD